jgi:hypothetical protein
MAQRAILLKLAHALGRLAKETYEAAQVMSAPLDRQRLIGLAQLLEREAARLTSRASSARWDSERG